MMPDNIGNRILYSAPSKNITCNHQSYRYLAWYLMLLHKM